MFVVCSRHRTQSATSANANSTLLFTVLGYDPLIPPQLLILELPASTKSISTVLRGRREAIEIIKQRDDRLLVVCGPCSLHNPATAVDYCSRLVELAAKLKDDLLIIMRAYL
jgi:3-deoxy-7-phosphoheptulonate synthase